MMTTLRRRLRVVIGERRVRAPAGCPASESIRARPGAGARAPGIGDSRRAAFDRQVEARVVAVERQRRRRADALNAGSGGQRSSNGVEERDRARVLAVPRPRQRDAR